ncbi:MAG: universal stress protein [Acidimicrobiales bacterium]
MYARVLVATDGSPTAQRAVDRAVTVSSREGSKLTVLSVGAEPKATSRVDAAVRAHQDSGVEIATMTQPGDPASVILDVAESGGYDLLVVGNKGMTGASRFFLGSVPNKVSHHTPCHLLIVHTS